MQTRALDLHNAARGLGMPPAVTRLGHGVLAMGPIADHRQAPRILIAHHDRRFVSGALRTLAGLPVVALALPEPGRFKEAATGFRPSIAFVSGRLIDGPRTIPALERARPGMHVLVVVDTPGPRLNLDLVGGTGFLGTATVAHLMADHALRRIVVELAGLTAPPSPARSRR